MDKHKRPGSLSMKTTIALIVIIFMMAVGGTLIAYTVYKNVFVKSFDIQFRVTDGTIVGINADPNLHFGSAPKGSASVVKEMNFLNDYTFPIMVDIEIEGAIAPSVVVEDNRFTLQPGERRSLKWTVDTSNLEPGNYTGNALIVYKRV